MTVCLGLDLLRPYGIFPATNSAPRAFRDPPRRKRDHL